MKGNFLAVDTSNGYLTILARKDGRVHTLYEPDCAAQHSVRLMPAAEEALAALSLPPADCAFFCAVTGPGSFTGIRIGISAVKGLCAATGAPALGVTSLETLAYTAEGSVLSVVPAGRGFYYVCAFGGDKRPLFGPARVDGEELARLAAAYPAYSVQPLPVPHTLADPAAGLFAAIEAAGEDRLGELAAFYLKKSQAEEEREKMSAAREGRA